jgi:hypothetical protein
MGVRPTPLPYFDQHDLSPKCHQRERIELAVGSNSSGASKKLKTDAKLTAALVDNILMRSDGRSVTLKALLSRKRIVGSNRTNGCDQGMGAIKGWLLSEAHSHKGTAETTAVVVRSELTLAG